VRRVLTDAAKDGISGDHHFYISFATQAEGVRLSNRLRQQYPERMTIVLQHQFWDLKMDDAAGLISVSLSFGGVPASLVIPLGAMTGFADPHVRFALRFSPDPAADAVEEPEPETEPDPDKPAEQPQVVSLDAFRRRPPSNS
jgi:hypothetical protein